VWVPPDVRDLVVDFVRCWSEKTEIGAGRFIHWLGVRPSKFYDWRERYGRVNEHNGWVPRDFWLQPWEKQAIIIAGVILRKYDLPFFETSNAPRHASIR
jgi:putative transposase